MKRFINTTTALAMVLASGPGFPLLAQDYPQVEIDGQIVICLPNKKAECPEDALCTIVKDPANCEKRATRFLKDLAAGLIDETMMDEPVSSDDPAVEEPAADAPVAEEPVTEEPVAEEPAVEEPMAEEPVAEEPVAEEPAVEEPAVEEPAAGEPATGEEPGVEEPAADPAATEEAAAEAVLEETPILDPALSEASPEEAALTEKAVLAFEPFEVFVGDQAVLCLPDKSVECPEGAICTVAKREVNCEANAARKMVKLTPVDVVVPDEEQVDAIADIIDAPAVIDPDTIDAVEATATVEGDAEVLPSDTETSPDAVVTEEVLTEDDTRAATEEFDAVPTEVAPGKKSGLSNLEIAGLAILGTLAVGVLLKNGNQVVENTGDRVVVEDGNGNYNIYKDDNALLREPGTTMRTETFADGSTRTVMVREDGTQVVTIRDATGRVLQRTAYNANGVQTTLIDDLAPETEIDVTRLPPAQNMTIAENATLPEIQDELRRIDRADYAHSFSLRQIRDIRQVRDLAPTIDVNNVTFDTGSSAIRKSEAAKLKRLGRLMAALIEDNPGEMFLVEGHTDAVGRAGYNLALSDRRAESVARALTQFYGVPAENLVVQGYGESELKVQSQGDERSNRRAVVRIITPLLKVSAR